MNEYKWSDLYIGLSHSFSVKLTEEMLVTFSRLSGDTSPLHTDPLFAKACGFKNILSYGMLTASFYSCLIGMHLPGKYSMSQGATIDFVSPSYAGDILLISGEIIQLNPSVNRVEVKAIVTNQDETIISRAKLRVGLTVK
jgi:3-hydroxybutyryl-CoA dehydratase